MATTINPANLNISITTSITLNKKTISTENDLVISGINEADTRIVTIPSASEVTVMNFSTIVSAGTFITNCQ